MIIKDLRIQQVGKIIKSGLEKRLLFKSEIKKLKTKLLTQASKSDLKQWERFYRV